MPLFRSSPFEELVVQATNEQNVADDWSAIMDICDKVVNYEDGQKFCLQAITKRLYHKVPRVVVQALILLDACVKNCGKKFHLEVSSRYFVTEIQKLLPKMHVSAGEKFRQLLKKWAENEFKDDPELGLIPSLYYKLKSEGVEFPVETEQKAAVPPISMDPDVVNSQQEEEDIIKAIALSLNGTESPSIKEDTTDSSSASSSATSEPVKVRALYDFEAVEENELTIKAGEIVLILDRSNNSWWKGSNHRGEGYLPANFVSDNLHDPIDPNVTPDEEETLPKQVDDEVNETVAIDEGTIQNALDWLNEIDPTEGTEDPEELLALERKSYAMAPLIEEKLQHIDRKCTILNSLNEELMEAVQLFYSLNSLGSGVSSAGATRLDTFPTREMQPSAVMPPRQHSYVVPHQYLLKASEKNIPSPTTLPPPTPFIPVEAQPTPTTGVQYPNPSQQSFPSYYYQPVYTMFSPEVDSGYQVMITGVPEQQRPPSAVATATKVESQRAISSANGTSTVNGTGANTLGAAALPTHGGVPIMYQPVVLQPHFSSTDTIYGGLSYNSYPSNVPIQQPAGAVMNSPSVSTYIPHYIAQVVMAQNGALAPQSINQPQSQTVNSEQSVPPPMEPNSLATSDPAHVLRPSHSAGEDGHPSVSNDATGNATSAASNPECDIKLSL